MGGWIKEILALLNLTTCRYTYTFCLPVPRVSTCILIIPVLMLVRSSMTVISYKLYSSKLEIVYESEYPSSVALLVGTGSEHLSLYTAVIFALPMTPSIGSTEYLILIEVVVVFVTSNSKLNSER